jgi:hypothetical protein
VQFLEEGVKKLKTEHEAKIKEAREEGEKQVTSHLGFRV